MLDKLLIGIIDSIGTFLAFWVYISNKKNNANKLFCLLTLSVLGWITFSYLSCLYYPLLLKRLTFGCISLFFLFAYFFSVFFPKEGKRYYLIDKLVILGCISFFLLSVGTNLIIENVYFTTWGTEKIFGVLSKAFYILAFLITSIVLFNILNKYYRSPNIERIRVQYLVIGILIFALLNIIFNIFFPLFLHTSRYTEFGNYAAIFPLAFTTYAIVKRQLFGIKVVFTEILVGVIAILLLINMIGSKSTFEYAWKGALFIAFLISGYLLIKSVIREIKLREGLQEAYQKLQKLDEAKTEFISIASHQLRTPLTAIKGYISMIIEGTYGKVPQRAKKPLKNVYKSNERLIKLVNDLLNISRIETGKIKLELEKISPEVIISNVINELEIEAKNKGIKLIFEKPKRKTSEIMLDREKIRQVILNIVDNAIKYTKEGQVVIKTKKRLKSLLIEISDTGEGMTREEISNLFKSFSRGRAGARFWVEGAGLGLYVAKKFVEMHNGKIWVESEGKGKGSTFYIELPIK